MECGGFHHIWDGSSLYPHAGSVAPHYWRHLCGSLLWLFPCESIVGSTHLSTPTNSKISPWRASHTADLNVRLQASYVFASRSRLSGCQTLCTFIRPYHSQHSRSLAFIDARGGYTLSFGFTTTKHIKRPSRTSEVHMK